MDERVIQFRVGVVVVVATIATAILIFLLGEWQPLFQGKYTVYIRFRHAPGVVPDTPIRKSGILIGRVKHVDLEKQGGAVVTARIDSKRELHRSEICRIGSGSLVLGDAVIEFVPSGDESADSSLIQDGEYIEGTVQSDPMKVLVDVAEKMPDAIHEIQQAGRELALLGRNVNTIVGNNEQQFERIMQSSERAIVKFEAAMSSIDELVGDPELKARLKKSLEELPDMFADARETLKVTRDTMTSFERVGKRAEANLENLEAFTTPLAEKGPALVSSVDHSIKNLDELLEQLVQFTEALNNREGTFGKLVYEPELYQRLNRAAGNIEDVTRKVRPLIDDARVIADKVARDPGQLGVRGVFNRQPAGSGVKYSLPAHRIRVPEDSELASEVIYEE